MVDFTRPSGWRFKGGMKTNNPPDALAEDRHVYLQNVRAYDDDTFRSRPQFVLYDAPPGGGHPVLALEPTLAYYKVFDTIYHNGLALDSGYAGTEGCSMVPFRPSSSPNPWEYVFDDFKASKFSGNTKKGVGTPEPQQPLDACVSGELQVFLDRVGGWVRAGAIPTIPTNSNRVTDTVGAVFLDPAGNGKTYLEVSPSQKYSKTMAVTIGGTQYVVDDVFPNLTTPLNITGIYYYSGNTGRCVVVPQNLAGEDPSLFTQLLLTSVRRGAIVSIGSELCLVLSSSVGPDGSLSFETSTVSTHTASEQVTIASAIAIVRSLWPAPTLVPIVPSPSGIIGGSFTVINLPPISGSYWTTLVINTTVPHGFIAGQTVTIVGSTSTPNINGPWTILAVSPTSFSISIPGWINFNDFIPGGGGQVGVIVVPISPGMAITSPSIDFTANTGIGTITQGLSFNPFVFANTSFQPDDYVHLSINADSIAALNELKILFDVSDGTFTKDFYYYTVRPSDIADAVQNTLTQLATAQIAEQRTIIDDESVILAHNQGRTYSSSQTGPGDGEWSEIKFPISAMTRVGNDESKTLQNAVSVQILVNAASNGTYHMNSLTVTGGFQPDVGYGGNPYQYWAVPRDSTTGSQGNPCPVMRYGVSPRRQSVNVPLPAYTANSDNDTWDIYRMGGAIDTPRYIGSTPIGNTFFTDNYSDATASAGRALARDNYEPFPSIGPPITPLSASIVGTTMVATFPISSNPTIQQLKLLLPGNEFNVGNQVFTLWTRPSLISNTISDSTWLFQFVENAGVKSNPLVQLNEPALADQTNPCVWGPDSNGVLFSVQDPLRPGVVNHTNPNNPDGASDAYTDDICAPSEPLQNGALLNQTSIVFSTKRAWAGYPKAGGSGYNWVEIPVGAGMACRFGIWSDGENIYFVSHDGIRKTSGGPSKNLTDTDLYNLFPHEGVFPRASLVTPGGTIVPPNYETQAETFRLSGANGYLYFDYLGIDGFYHTLVCDLKRETWSIDVSGFNATAIHAGTTSPGGSQQLYLGDSVGGVLIEQSSPNPGNGELVACSVVTRELMNDLRADTMFGDAALDSLPASAITATPIFLGTPFGTTTVVPVGTRVVSPIDLLGQQLKRSLGMMLQWTDQGRTSVLYSWQPSIVPQPETSTDRFSDWDDGGYLGNKFFQGVLIEADTFGQDKVVAIRSADDGLVKATLTINHNGQQQKPYSFLAPFRSHLVRDEPNSIPWKRFGLKYVFEPTPSNVKNWITQPTTHDLTGYQHVKELLFAYNATAQVTFTLTVDGAAISYVLPPTTGFQKVLISLQAVKGLFFQYSAVSAENFQVAVNDIEVKVKAWGDPGPYINWRRIGAIMGDAATI